jgi:hypothetical protein
LEKKMACSRIALNLVVISTITLAAYATPAAATRILLTGEGDAGTSATDSLAADGLQDPVFVRNVVVDNNPANAAFGSSSFYFSDLAPYGDENPAPNAFALNRLELPDSQVLGSSFTLAAQVKGELDRPSIIFSSYLGGGALNDELIFIANAGASGVYERMLLQLGRSETENEGALDASKQTSTWGSVSDGDYHHIAITFDNGQIKFFRDGVHIVSEDWDVSGKFTSFTGAFNIGVGNNRVAGYDQFVGWMDDVLILDRALSPEEINSIAANGAASLVPEPSMAAVLGLGCVAICQCRRQRAR